jgi:U3 small nucleolar RNA-associated protein 25
LNHTLIFIPSYFDFTRIRNYLDSQDIEFGILNEYSTVSDSSHDRDYFKQGIHHFLLYTERAHFFRRYHLKGIQRIIFYGLPDNTNYYSELINMIDIPEELKLIHNDVKQSTYPYFSLSLVTQFDQLKWERIIGSSRIEGAMKGKRDILTFL